MELGYGDSTYYSDDRALDTAPSNTQNAPVLLYRDGSSHRNFGSDRLCHARAVFAPAPLTAKTEFHKFATTPSRP
ncbi:MAG TPA: hypothetical protein V6D08_13385 [Candidatus Obscuribacterales bacterium]